MKLFSTPMCIVAMLLSAGFQQALALELDRAREGTLACVGNHLLRQGGSEISFSGYSFRNFNPNSEITIDSVTIYDAKGTILTSLVGGMFPPGFNQVLGPNQTTSFTTRDIFGDSDIRSRAAIPLQTIVKWRADKRGFALFANVARQDRGRDRITGAIREQRARGIIPCAALN